MANGRLLPVPSGSAVGRTITPRSRGGRGAALSPTTWRPSCSKSSESVCIASALSWPAQTHDRQIRGGATDVKVTGYRTKKRRGYTIEKVSELKERRYLHKRDTRFRSDFELHRMHIEESNLKGVLCTKLQLSLHVDPDTVLPIQDFAASSDSLNVVPVSWSIFPLNR